jgi:hypothetical protein
MFVFSKPSLRVATALGSGSKNYVSSSSSSSITIESQIKREEKHRKGPRDKNEERTKASCEESSIKADDELAKDIEYGSLPFVFFSNCSLLNKYKYINKTLHT